MESKEKKYIIPERLRSELVNYLKNREEGEILDSLDEIEVYDQWDDKKKWYMDISKSFVAAFFSALVTLIIFSLVINKKEFKWKTSYDIKQRVLTEFEEANLKYFATGYDAIKDAFSGKARGNSSVIERFEDDRNDDLDLALNRLEVWYNIDATDTTEISRSVKNLIKAKKEVFQKFNATLTERANLPKTLSVSDSILLQAKINTFKAKDWKIIDRSYHSNHKKIMEFCRAALREEGALF